MTARFSSEIVNELNLKDEYLRLIAFVSMIIDHIAFLYQPENFIARGIGRIALPIFLYLLVKGWKRTRSVDEYFFRILQWGIISQIVIFTLSVPVNHNNILLMMCYCLIMLDTCKKWGWQWLGCFCVGAELLNLEYGYYAIIVCYLMQLKFDEKFWLIWIMFHLLAITLGFPKIQILALFVPVIIESGKYISDKKTDNLIVKIPRKFWYVAYSIQWIIIRSLGIFWAI